LSKQALYDFDGTITSKDTTILLLVELLKLKPLRFFGLIWFLLRMHTSASTLSKQKYKNKAIGYLIKDLSDMHLSKTLKDFSNKVRLLYRPSILIAIDQAYQEGCTLLVVTASPSFAIKYCVSDLPVIVIGTEFEKKENIYTGLLKSKNCYGQEKVNRINKWAASKNLTLNVQSAWSDHLSDFDMLNMAAKRNWIGGEQLRKLVMELDAEANFLNLES
jgi:HAD superfamily phosphoserine phosphatase-like hydrolase